MNDKILSAMTVVLLISGLSTLGYVGFKTFWLKRQQRVVGELGCLSHRETRKMDNSSMSGLLEDGSMFDVLHGYYKCNQVQAGDLVFVTPSPTIKPSVKKVWGLPQDQFSLRELDDQGKFEVLINNKAVTQKSGNLTLSEDQIQPIRSFETARKGVLGPNEYLLFGNHGKPTNDSVRFGVLKKNHLLGRVVESSK